MEEEQSQVGVHLENEQGKMRLATCTYKRGLGMCMYVFPCVCMYECMCVSARARTCVCVFCLNSTYLARL